MPLERPFKEIPKDAAEWNRFFRQLIVTPDAGSVTESTITDGSITASKLAESYYTETEIDTSLALYYTKALLDAGQLDTRYYTETEVTALIAALHSESSFTGTLTGCTTIPTGLIEYSISNGLCSMSVPQINATSNTTDMTITGAPSAVFPSSARRCLVVIQDNGSVQLGLVQIEVTGVLTFYSDVTGAVFTNTGTKGVESMTFTYQL